MAESTFLSRSFGDQGVKLRIRKEPRVLGYVFWHVPISSFPNIVAANGRLPRTLHRPKLHNPNHIIRKGQCTLVWDSNLNKAMWQGLITKKQHPGKMSHPPSDGKL